MSLRNKELETTLDEKISRDVIRQRDGGGRKPLDYLETWYVIDRLNQVFGNLNWDSETVDLIEVQGQDKPTYRARVRITVLQKLGEGQYLKTIKEGFGYGRDKSANNPHEMAVKEAESDALKRAAMKFGRSMGLALYDKSQEYIEENTDSRATEPKAERKSPTVQVETNTSTDATDEKVKERIKATWEVLIKKNKVKPDNAKDYLAKFGVGSIKALNKDQSLAFLNELNQVLYN